MGLSDTPRANRLHIGLFGRRNSGKSSIINALTGQETAIVSDVPGTTADPVYKAMELYGIGPVVFIDTAGYDDEGALGQMRVAKTKDAMEKTDIALMVIDAVDFVKRVSDSKKRGEDWKDSLDLRWAREFQARKTPVIFIANKVDAVDEEQLFSAILALEAATAKRVNRVSAIDGTGIAQIRESLLEALPEEYEAQEITGTLAKDGDVVLLIMPQDIQAPKGRLILPQVQTLRELLDKKCIVSCATTDRLEQALESLGREPDLIITDSQVFPAVYEKKPKGSKLTSFSVLFAGYKGDSAYFMEGAEAIEGLCEDSRVLIAEACAHAPLSEDIGREQIPRLLRKRTGEKLRVDVVCGQDFPDDLSPYDLVIHCGACMFNRKYVLGRVAQAKAQGVPMTNYGMAIAKMSGILDKIDC